MNTSFDEQNALNYLTEEENAKLFWGHRLFGIKSQIFTTTELASTYKNGIETKDTIKTFSYFKIKFLILILILICIVALIISTSFYHKDVSKSPYILSIIYVLFVFSLVFLQFFGKTRIFKVTLFKDGIIIKGTLYRWNEIYKIYIIIRPYGNQKFYYLVLALNTGVLQRYEFTNLMNWRAMHIKLSAYIEHYKNFA